MEEQRIGMLYVNLIKSRFRKIWDFLFHSGRQSVTFPVLLVFVLLVPVVGWYLHLHGKFASLKREVKGESQTVAVVVPKPGGEPATVLTRTETPGSSLPEFLSATVLPGRGMDVLQITAFVPGRGEVELLSAPTVQQVADGSSDDRSGANDLRGAIEAPWGGSLAGVLSPLANSLSVAWHGHTIEVPTNAPGGRAIAEGGLLGAESTEGSTSANGDASIVAAVFRATGFDSRWPSKSDVAVSVQMAPRALDITVTARNVGAEPEPMGIGWHPRFVIPNADREALELRLPGAEALEIGDRGVPTGKFVSAPPNVTRVQMKPGPLGQAAWNESLVHLKPGILETGAGIELRDPAGHFGLRMTALSNSIRELRVISPAGSKYIVLGMQTNYDDPLGRQWTGEEGGGIATLQPGESIEWKVRLEIFPLVAH